MRTSYLPPQCDPPLSPRQTLPTMYDLPSENPEEPGLPDEFHHYQPILLRQTFKPLNYHADEIFIGSDINLYFDLRHANWYKRPDWFAVVGVDRLYEKRDLRLSYVMWQEQVSPFVVIELVSPGTEDEDLGRTIRQPEKPPTKWDVYQKILRVPYYIVFSRYTDIMKGFCLIGGQYEEMVLNQEPLVIPQLGLSLRLWQGCYEEIERLWLRWFTQDGELILTPDELAQKNKNELEIARQETQVAQQKAARLAAKLRELNIDPDVI